MDKERYQDLSVTDQRFILRVAASAEGSSAHLIEKDVWVVAALDVLFSTSFSKYLTLKGGTSLSKAWRAISRFSEDVDITFDIRAFAPDLVGGADFEVVPKTRSQEKRWTRLIRTRLAEWVRDHALPTVSEKLLELGFKASVRADGDCLFIDYQQLFTESEFVLPRVKIEFGARSTGEPNITKRVVCDAAEHLPDLVFPETRPTVMIAERTFWEKATAIHVFCRQQRRRGERLSRHWFDLVQLDESGIVKNALSDQELALSVARHKAMFFRENDVEREPIDYHAAVSGHLQLVPSDAALEVLRDDYTNMLEVGMLLDVGEPFEVLMDHCSEIEKRANGNPF